jgi:hypothetical protein
MSEEEQFDCRCGPVRKTVKGATAKAAFRWFCGYLRMRESEIVGMNTVTVSGPMRLRHHTTEYVFDLKTGDLQSSRDLRPRGR